MKPNTVKIELESPNFGGEYVANIAEVSSVLTDYSHRKLVRLCCDYWPELTRTVEQRKELRRLPRFVLAVMVRQL